jgi:2,3-bisphosphoglycerate-independent phosphoglycerate mutase
VVDVLVIPDGAAPAAMEAADTPVLDALAAKGTVVRVRTTPEGLPPGSETGIPVLLGVVPDAPVGRGWVDAAAYGVDVPPGLTPWRVDVLHADGTRASAAEARAVAAEVPGAAAVGGHRLVVVSVTRPSLHHVWPAGQPLQGCVARPTTLVCAPGAAAGCGRLLGATVVIPPGATGDVDTDLGAKARAALSARSQRVVVHVGGPDEAAHRRDPRAVVAALERMDAELLAPLADAVDRLAVCPDHRTDPSTGVHSAAPVTAVVRGDAALGAARIVATAVAA